MTCATDCPLLRGIVPVDSKNPQGSLWVFRFVLSCVLSLYLRGQLTKKASPNWTTPDTGKNGCSAIPIKSDLYVLSLHADHCFQHGVHSGDGFRVGLKAALRGNHLHKFA